MTELHEPGIGGRIITAVELTWREIRLRHPDVPEVVATMASGTAGRRAGMKYGHFGERRWNRAGDSVHELFLGGEGLERGAVPVLGTLLHEAAHGVATTRGIQDTSRQARWHNREFKRLAEELGIVVTKDPSIGWSPTTVPDSTAEAYAGQLAVLADALTAFRRIDGRRTGNSNGVVLVCGCGRRIRASASCADRGPIMCGVCGERFEAEV